MSGGIDSAVAALLIKEMGFDASGATMRVCQRLLPDGSDGIDTDIRDARDICARLGIPHKVYDLKNEFHNKVIRDFIDTYMGGGTPNPCVVCNKFLKFGVLLDSAIADGADLIATGHYARIERSEGGRFLLKKAIDTKKDQMFWSL